MLAGHLVAPAGLDVVVLPVRVVDLQLDELHLRVLGEQLVQHVGLVVEGEAHVLEQALLLHLQGVVPNAELVKGLGAVVAAVVQQVEVEIPGTGAPQRGLQHLLGLAGGLGPGPGGQLGGQLEALPGVPVHQSGFYSLLGFAPQIAVGRVKIGEAGLQELVHHLFGLFQVHFLVQHGQAHQPKAQLGDVFA